MFDIELVHLDAQDTFTKTKQTISIFGKVKFGGGVEEPIATAELLLQKQPTWASESYQNLIFQSVAIHYLAAGSLPVKQETKDLEVEFHFEAAIYLFSQPFDLHLDIGPSKNKGFSISAVHKKSLDLEIVKLTGHKDPEMGNIEDGPTNYVDPSQKAVNNNKTTTSASLAVKAGGNIFNCDPIPVNMGYESGTKSFFVSNGNLAFEGLKTNYEFANEIKDAKSFIQTGSNRKNRKKPGCGELVDYA
ncbi:hypothetical protein Neosp_015132 [[Neocosmospora] mangrovei]